MDIYIIIVSLVFFLLGFLDLITIYSKCPKSQKVRTILRTLLILITPYASFWFIWGHRKESMIKKFPVWPFFIGFGILIFILFFVLIWI